ncbi:hypothetical protein A6M08_04620 [Neisseria meningitidis]|nr:hypothetical protein A6L28_02060 [Neisseria meningitidis]ANX25664.1 hypothetical protein A6L27_04590 [Neisseria meningitidis]ANX30402.1 hypothetical protein A6L17_08005 [Neisseria meningitidis]ANX31403.1 hypothetical protein A6M06_01705 [Neisseria meningitidis]ANX34970.1 hypothetical protein A6L25_10415 [Neisseria meningitidis]
MQERPYATAYWPFFVRESCTSNANPPLSELLKLINRQLTEKGLKIEKASAAVVDATIIQTAGSKQRQAR